MVNVITIGNATIDAGKFAAYSKQAMKELRQEYDAKEQVKNFSTDFKETVEAVAMTTKLDKKELNESAIRLERLFSRWCRKPGVAISRQRWMYVWA